MKKRNVLDLLNPAKSTVAERITTLQQQLEELGQADKLREVDALTQHQHLLTEYRSVTTALLQLTQRTHTESSSIIKGLKETISAQTGDISQITRVLDTLLVQREAEQVASQEFMNILTVWLNKH